MSQDGVTKTGVGWHCKVCDCFLRDSLTYLDHINGKKHQRNLGFSMRVERSTKDQVSSRLAMLAKEKEKQKNALLEENEESFHDIVRAKDEEAQRRKEERARQRKERKKMKKAVAAQPQGDSDNEEEANQDPAQNSNDGEEETEVDEGGIDHGIAAMMGFSGFGGGNKNR
jgi:U4/U6.U5 tri-snRNP component SNU23